MSVDGLGLGEEKEPPQEQARVVLDPSGSSRPLGQHSQEDVERYYAPQEVSSSGEDRLLACPLKPPPRPASFSDPYLYPTLSRNEKDRLKRFYYLTEGADKDQELLEHLADLVSLVKETSDYEICNLGFSDIDNYVQMVAEGMDTVTVPRRESICSHTIVLQPGTILDLPDMTKDWRFKDHPQVTIAGLRSYAGTQLNYVMPESGQPVVLGSLCLLSKSPKPPLSPKQRSRLLKVANAIVHAIVGRAQLVRQDLQKQRLRSLSSFNEQPPNAHTVVERSLELLQQTFAGCSVTYQPIRDGCLALPGEGDIPCSAFVQDLWENADLIDTYINEHNNQHSPSRQPRTMRAIACKVDDSHYLVVSAPSLRIVLDDETDVLFIQSVGLVIAKQQQDELLREAVSARESFLRDVQHSIRTSLNGILSASEMLLDEAWAKEAALAIRRASNESVASRDSGNQKSLLNIIDSSGRGLLAIINNLLRFQTTEKLSPKAEVCSIANIEEDVITAIIQSSSTEKLSKVTIIADNTMQDHVDTLLTDSLILRQILAILVQNAMDATEEGSVKVFFGRGPSGSLTVDVIDTGRGIPSDCHERIFLPFEKADAFTPTAGLGLSFARQYATSLGGTVKLVASTPDRGSTFRFELPRPVFACAKTQHDTLFKTASSWTYWTQAKDVQQRGLETVFEVFERYGWTRTKRSHADIIVDLGCLADDSQVELEPYQISLRIVSALEHNNASGEMADTGRVVLCALPLYRNRIVSCFQHLARFLATRSGDASLVRTLSAMEVASVVGKRAGSELRLLLVDDNDFNLKILQTYCKKRGYDYAVAMDGQEAYDVYVKAIADGKPFSFCVMDLQMPRCTGDRSTQMIREYETAQDLEQCLIYMVTGQSGDAERAAAMAAGCDGFYVKPLRIKTLDELLAAQFDLQSQ